MRKLGLALNSLSEIESFYLLSIENLREHEG
jgi:hypothetical protein